MAFRTTPKELKSILLYFLDWLFVGGTALVAWSFSRVTPNLRPFSTLDTSIGYPYQQHAKISTSLLAAISTIIPAMIISIMVLALPIHLRKRRRARFWLLNTSLLGLGLSLAGAMIVTDGMKNLVGKPRPDLLARCQVDRARVEQGSFRILGTATLYTAEVCTSWHNVTADGIDRAELVDGFRSWVSGHSSLSFAGLTYLTIFLCNHAYYTLTAPSDSSSSVAGENSHPSAPLALLLGVPILTAVYVATTRYSDFRHHGVDILFGSLLGVAMAFLGWAMYGSRGVHDNRILGRLAQPEKDNYEFTTDLESGALKARGPTPRKRTTIFAEGSKSPSATQGEGEGGALQLPKVSLSISTIEGPNDMPGKEGKSVAATDSGIYQAEAVEDTIVKTVKSEGAAKDTR